MSTSESNAEASDTRPQPDLIALTTISHPDPDSFRVIGYQCRDAARGENAIFLKDPEPVTPTMQAEWLADEFARVYVMIEEGVIEHDLHRVQGTPVMENGYRWDELEPRLPQ